MNTQITVVLLIFDCYVSGLNNLSFAIFRSFPKDFLFGVATSAYQVEGAWDDNGKSESNWDYFTHARPGIIKDRRNGDVACDSYHKINEDIKMLKELRVNFYRFSLSWTRVIPDPFLNKLNPDGIAYYNDLINLLLKNHIQPVVTLFHFDLPNSLQQLGGFTNSIINEYMVKYARAAFENFGDRVKIWITFNEPHIFCLLGYGSTDFVPLYNISGIAEYLCASNVLKTHAHIYHMYNNTFKEKQKGVVTIALDSSWFEPASSKEEDVEAAERAMEFELGLFAHPIFTKEGDFPSIVKELVANRSMREGFEQSRLPQFNQSEVEYIRGTHDNVFCLNHYSTQLAEHKNPDSIGMPSFYKDMNVHLYHDPSWPSTAFSPSKVVPFGFRKVLVWVKENYGNPIIFVTENGYADKGGLFDFGRINFFKSYLQALLEAIYDHNVRVKRYTAWSVMDNFEWMNGYTLKFGLYDVDFNDPNRPRKPKLSARYYKRVISNRRP